MYLKSQDTLDKPVFHVFAGVAMTRSKTLDTPAPDIDNDPDTKSATSPHIVDPDVQATIATSPAEDCLSDEQSLCAHDDVITDKKKNMGANDDGKRTP